MKTRMKKLISFKTMPILALANVALLTIVAIAEIRTLIVIGVQALKNATIILEKMEKRMLHVLINARDYISDGSTLIDLMRLLTDTKLLSKWIVTLYS